jgi:hypothetical protein
MNKYRNRKTGGYDSRRESRRAFELKILERKGEISGLKEQVRYELIPSIYEGEGKNRRCIERACSYVADFIYIDKNGALAVEDTKGFRTPDYIIKRKLMLHVHGIKITEK